MSTQFGSFRVLGLNFIIIVLVDTVSSLVSSPAWMTHVMTMDPKCLRGPRAAAGCAWGAWLGWSLVIWDHGCLALLVVLYDHRGPLEWDGMLLGMECYCVLYTALCLLTHWAEISRT